MSEAGEECWSVAEGRRTNKCRAQPWNKPCFRLRQLKGIETVGTDMCERN